jgi:ADP-heptose:LPS heptosyltransferase
MPVLQANPSVGVFEERTMKQVLIINITRMGDLAQTVPLMRRLEEEWPGVAIDLVIDTRLALMAVLLPGLRHVHTYQFETVVKHDLRGPRGDMPLSPDMVAWAQSLAAIGYDRVINLTFTRWSGLLAAVIGAPDTRGVTVGRTGAAIMKGPWLAHVVDLQQDRRFNRFNLVDLYALGGSGPGSFTPIRLSLPGVAAEWAEEYLDTIETEHALIAVQIGASQARKAWRPEYFGRTMAALSRHLKVVFVLIGTRQEAESVQQAVAGYHQAGGVGPFYSAVGQIDMSQLAALLSRCQLLITNDTGPMHLAVGMGTPVIDLSVGHVDFRETGPYGPGHWVVQPVLDCAPCGYTQMCVHHACKDQIVPDQVAELALHVLGLVPFPTSWTGVRVYESCIDEDGLACYQQRAGQRDPVADWYGTFWRRYWYEQFTGHVSRVALDHMPSDLADEQQWSRELPPELEQVVQHAERLASLCHQPAVTASDLKAAHDKLIAARQVAMPTAMASPAFGPVTTALLRALYDARVLDTRTRAEHHAQAYRTWKVRMDGVRDRLEQAQGGPGAQRAPLWSRLPVVEVSK